LAWPEEDVTLGAIEVTYACSDADGRPGKK
jgi:hypothetical protein